MIQYENSIQDYINFNLFHYKNSKSSRRIKYFLQFILPIYLLVFYLLPNLADRLIFSYFFMWAVFSSVYITFIHYLLSSYLRLRVKILYAEGKKTQNIGTHKMTLDDEGITDESPNELTKINWEGISKISKDAHNIYIYTSAMNAFVIPLKYFNDTDRENEIVNYLKSKVDSGDVRIATNKTKKQVNGFKKFVVFLISGIGVYLLLFQILFYGIKYDKKSVSAMLSVMAIISAFAGSKLLSKYSWSVIFVSFFIAIVCSAILILILN